MDGAPFEIVRELGHGGMGLVYEVRLPGDPRAHVAKLMTATGPQARERFRREGELVARLDAHPGIVRAVRAGFVREDVPYIVFEKAEGEPLGSLLGREGALPVEQALRIGRELSAALAHAHAQGVVHRDVKPDNIIIGLEGQVRLLDFGLAVAADLERLTQTGHTVGTPLYMAMEQVAGADHPVGPWTDVHATGLVLFECLTGRSPFNPGEAVAILGQVIAKVPEPVDTLRSEAGPDLSAVIACCLEKEPTERYPDAAALLADLERVAAGESPSVSGVRRWRPRKRELGAALMAAAVLTLLAVAGWAFFAGGQGPGQSTDATNELGAEALLQGAEAAAATDPAEALGLLEQLPRRLTPEQRARRRACHARIAVAQGRLEEALPQVRKLREGGAAEDLVGPLVNAIYAKALEGRDVLAALGRIVHVGPVRDPELAAELARTCLRESRARVEALENPDPYWAVVSEAGTSASVRKALEEHYRQIGWIQQAAPRVSLVDADDGWFLVKCFVDSQDMRYNPKRSVGGRKEFFARIQKLVPDDPLIAAARALTLPDGPEAQSQAELALACLERAAVRGDRWREVRDEAVVRLAELQPGVEGEALLNREAARADAGPRTRIRRAARLLERGETDDARRLLAGVELPPKPDGVAETHWASWYNERDALQARVEEER